MVVHRSCTWALEASAACLMNMTRYRHEQSVQTTKNLVASRWYVVHPAGMARVLASCFASQMLQVSNGPADFVVR